MSFEYLKNNLTFFDFLNSLDEMEEKSNESSSHERVGRGMFRNMDTIQDRAAPPGSFGASELNQTHSPSQNVYSSVLHLINASKTSPGEHRQEVLVLNKR